MTEILPKKDVSRNGPNEHDEHADHDGLHDRTHCFPYAMSMAVRARASAFAIVAAIFFMPP